MDNNWREKSRLSQAEVAGLAWPQPSASWKKARPRSDHWATRERAEGGRSLHQEKRYNGHRRRIALGRSGSPLCHCERETWSHRHTLCERGRGYNRTARGGYRGTFRPDLRRERKGNLLYGAEGPSPLQRRRLDYPELFGLKRVGTRRLYRLRRE